MLGRIGRDVGGGRASYNRELGEGERQREGDADIQEHVRRNRKNICQAWKILKGNIIKRGDLMYRQGSVY